MENSNQQTLKLVTQTSAQELAAKAEAGEKLYKTLVGIDNTAVFVADFEDKVAAALAEYASATRRTVDEQT